MINQFGGLDLRGARLRRVVFAFLTNWTELLSFSHSEIAQIEDSPAARLWI